MKKQCLLFCMLLLAFCAQAQDLKTENVILITFDGLRWQEVFEGGDQRLMRSEKYRGTGEALRKQFWHQDPQVRRKLLMPFFWSTLQEEGQLLGNRNWRNKVNMTTKSWISYPGYNEILTGYADPKVTSNDQVNNQNITVLEKANQLPEYRGKVAVYGSWNVFPFIYNEPRSGIPVNAAYEAVEGQNLSPQEVALNAYQQQIPRPWETVRPDALTFAFALEYLKRENPRVMHIGFGETDEFAHEGKYDAYLKSIYEADAMIGELWAFVQSHPQYKDKTTLIITTDHGRGHRTNRGWTKHGRIWYPGSNEIWVAMLGPDTPATGEVKSKGQFYQYQIAETMAYYLGIPFKPAKAVEQIITANP